MKKIILMLTLMIGFVVGTKAQVAIENPKAFDNISIGVNTGVSTPLDFNSMFPLNLRELFFGMTTISVTLRLLLKVQM